MVDLPWVFAASEIPLLTTVYWACGTVGAGLVLISSLSGHHADADVDISVGADTDFDADFHADIDVSTDADVDLGGHVAGDIDADAAGVDAHVDAGAAHHTDGHIGEASSLASWFSIRFLVFFLATFGVLGVVLTHMTAVGAYATLGVSVVGGIVAGQCVHRLFRRIRRASGNSALRTADYVNQVARVTIPVSHTIKGEIALTVLGGQQYIPATSKHADDAFQAGEEVGVLAYGGGVAKVVSRKEFEFLNHTQKGGKQ
ncbi:MAG: hypothetical protein ABII12_16380 [Planctomycetota bacterium]